MVSFFSLFQKKQKFPRKKVVFLSFIQLLLFLLRYLHELLKQDVNCCQKLTLNLCVCCGDRAFVFASMFGGTIALYWGWELLCGYV